MKFSILPANADYYNYFEKASANLLDGARLLQKLLESSEEMADLVAQITEIEHRGDFIVHEVMHLLPRTLVTPIDSDDIQRLVTAVDDALDAIQAAASRLVIYQVTEVKKPARRLGRLIVEAAQELDEAMKGLRDKKKYPEVQQRVVQINTVENNADRVLEEGLSGLVAHREDLFDLIRWKEIYQILEDTTDRIEDAGDVMQRVMIANA